MQEPKKILLVEDDKRAVCDWIKGLGAEGFDLEEKDPETLFREVKNGHIKLFMGPHEVHLTCTLSGLDGLLVEEKKYDLAVMDHWLDEDETSPAVKTLLDGQTPKIVLISGDRCSQREGIEEAGFNYEELLQAGRVVPSRKPYAENAAFVRQALGLPDQKAPLGVKNAPSGHGLG